MTWFEDLTPYSYLPTKPSSGSPPTLNVGWLEREHRERLREGGAMVGFGAWET
jgi:hypothetical protein